MRKEIVNLSDKSTAPFPSAVKASDFIFVSGQVGHVDDKGNPLVGIEAQTRQCLENMKKVLSKAGSSLSRVVKVTVFLSDVKDYPKMNEVYRKYFQEEPPARSTAIASLAIPGMLIEIDCIAY